MSCKSYTQGFALALMAMRGRLRRACNMAGAALYGASFPSLVSRPAISLLVFNSSLESSWQYAIFNEGGMLKFFSNDSYNFKCSIPLKNRVFQQVRSSKHGGFAVGEMSWALGSTAQKTLTPGTTAQQIGAIHNVRILEDPKYLVQRDHSRHFASKNWAEDLEEDSGEDSSEEPGENSPENPDSDGSNLKKRWHIDRLCPTSLRIRQQKERDYDDIIEREKKLKIVLRIKEVLTAEPDRTMTLQDLGKSRDYIGLTGKRRIIAFLKKYPAVFEVHETVECGALPSFRLTTAAETVHEEEKEVRRGMKVELVTKIRKLLMMSSTRQLSLGKIAHLMRDLGLPDDFRKKFVYKYPKYFRVLENEAMTNDEGLILELVKWSPRLAITAAEKEAQELMQQRSLETPPRLEIQLPKRYRLSNKDKYVIYKFHELECPSPYEDSSHNHPSSAEAEKRAVLLVQEILSLTLDKRMLVDHLTHFRKEFKFSNQIRGMLVRHPEHFYVSKKGARDTVFLRAAFEGIHVPGQKQEHLLKNKHPLVLIKEKLAALMAIKRVVPSQELEEESLIPDKDSTKLGEELQTPLLGLMCPKVCRLYGEQGGGFCVGNFNTDFFVNQNASSMSFGTGGSTLQDHLKQKPLQQLVFATIRWPPYFGYGPL